MLKFPKPQKVTVEYPDMICHDVGIYRQWEVNEFFTSLKQKVQEEYKSKSTSDWEAGYRAAIKKVLSLLEEEA